MASVPYPLYLSLTDGCMGMARCHTLLFIPYRWVHGYGRMPYPPIYPLPVGAWVWQDAIPSYLSLTSGCMGMAGCHTLLFIPYRWVHGYGRMPYPPIYPLPMGAWVWQDAIPSYLRFTTKITIKLTHRNHDKPNQKQSSRCVRTHTI